VFNRKILLGSVCALAMAVAGPALADDMGGMNGFSGTLSGDYSNTHVDHGGSADVWGGNGEGMMALGSTGVNAQVDGGYHAIDIHGLGNLDVWNANGSLFAIINNGGRLGATYGYAGFSGGGSSAHLSNYGIFGEWWASDDITVAGKVGGFDSNSFASGYYAGGQFKYYALTDLALGAGIDQTHFNGGGGSEETDYTLSGEYLLSETTPISIAGSWAYSDAAGGHAQTWGVALKYYCNDGSGAATLVDRQRSSGTLGYDVGMSVLAFRF